MNTRIAFSILLLSLGCILAFLPAPGGSALFVKPDKVLNAALNSKSSFTADQVAKFVVSEDSTVQIIDLRSPDEFKKCNIPGSVNLSYKELVEKPKLLEDVLNRNYPRNIFYSNGDIESNYAYVIASGLGFTNVFVMKGGLNNWFETVMNSEFKGERISARENALFEARTRAKRLFTQINSLPDSLKNKFMNSRQSEAKKLDGGCE